jgi:predicted membrane protein
MRHDRAGDATQRMAFGVIILVLGVLFLLDKLDVIEMGHLGDYWPLIFVAIGLGRVLQPAGSAGRGMGVVFIVVGAWWTLANLDVVEYYPLHYWPVILILIGASILWRAFEGPGRQESVPPPPPPLQPSIDPVTGATVAPPAPPSAPGWDSESTLNAVAVLGGVERKSAARDFRGGSMTAIMGGCVVDLRHASIASGEAVIDAFAMWGGVEIKVPRDWLVVSKGTPMLGGFVDSTTPPPAPTGKVLVVRGAAIMGGVETKN